MRISNNEHLKHSWRVHNLLCDFKIEDTWLLPVTLGVNNNTKEVKTAFAMALEESANTGVTALLFKFRLFLGRVFGWDNKEQVGSAIRAGSIRARFLTQESLEPTDLPNEKFVDFETVYDLSTESLLEIENKTVHAACHFGKISMSKNTYGIQMTIYVKPKGVLGICYMQLIKPFRHYLVYPVMLKQIGKQWNKYITASSHTA